MGVKRNCLYFVADFETTVYEGQTRTDAWASALAKMFTDTDDVIIHNSIDETFDYLRTLETNIICYYHNLKFDGSFWIDFLMNRLNYTPALSKNNETNTVSWFDNKSMPNNAFKCSISTMGQWYTVVIKTNNHFIEFRDSYKLLPFSVERIGKSFKTKHKKLTMEYKGFRYPGCEITDEEKHYIANDVLVVKEALEFMFKEGHSKLTIGACCLSEFHSLFDKKDYNSLFPNLYEIDIDEDKFGYKTAGDYIRASYSGGWCYLVDGKQNKIYKNGTTADVNSLYPSMMSSESGNRYPVGHPKFYSVNDTPYEQEQSLRIILSKDKTNYYFCRVRTRFTIKEGKLPFIHIRNSLRFKQNECVKSTDWIGKDGKPYKYYWFGKNKDELQLHDTAVTMVLTATDLALFLEHYDTENFVLLDFAQFRTEIGLFDPYMEKYKKIKQTSTGALRELAKLFLNNLYGKMAASTDSSFKVPMQRDDGSIGFYDVTENDKKPGYIPIGSAITSYARNFTIRAAQMNYHGPNKRGFIYADTDSIHCDLEPNEIRGIVTHPTDFCAWKLECQWDEAIFVRQKTYIEHNIIEDGEPIETPYYNIKCAGMPETSKSLFRMSLEKTIINETDKHKYTQQALETINKQYELSDFKVGLVLPGKLLPRRIPGGTLLVETSFEMR